MIVFIQKVRMDESIGRVQESLKQEITCNICCELMDDPRTLLCTHVYCNQCLKKLVLRCQVTVGYLQCPECRQKVQLPNDTADFPIDFRTVRLKEVYEKMLQISQPTNAATTSDQEKSTESTLICNTHGHPIAMYCISCRDVLCQKCLQGHTNHTYDYLIKENIMLENINLYAQPTAHKNRLDDFSLTIKPPTSNIPSKDDEDRPVKTKMMTMEEDHNSICTSGEEQWYVVKQETISDQQVKLESMATAVRKYKSKLSTAIVDVTQVKADVDDQARMRQLQVDSAFDGMIHLLQDKREQLQKQIADELKEKKKVLSQQKGQLTSLYSEIAEVLIVCSSKTIQDEESITQKLENLQKVIKLTSLKPAVTADIGASLTEGDLIQTCCKKCVFRYRIPDMSRCQMTGEFLQAPESNIQSNIRLQLCDSKGDLCPGLHTIEAELLCMRDKSTTIGVMSYAYGGEYCISFNTGTRGTHVLNIKIDDILYPQCPITLFVRKKPQTLGAPVYTISNPNGPTGLHFYDKHLVVSEQSSFTVSVFDVSGSRILTLETGGEVAIDQESSCYFVANAISYQLHKFDTSGTCVKQAGTQGSEPGQLLNPGGMHFHNGELYIADSSNHRIQIFDRDLNLLRHFGTEGTSNGCFKSPRDVTIDDDGTLYITDTLNNRIQVMNNKGKFIRNIRKPGKPREYPHMPYKMSIFKGHIFTTEYQANSVCVFTLSGDFVTTFGHDYITHPEGIAIDNDGFVYVTSNKEKIVVF